MILDEVTRTGAVRVSDLVDRLGVSDMTVRRDLEVLARRGLLEKVWDENIDPFTNVVRVTMMKLRRKLGDPPIVETVPGVGYRIP
ncbi:winged helix-turn-helix domain-containing protein [Kibdelosporangium lantanae]|uniref:Winged helix-turn-helix domain-containing protein n=1 Tax=Kibdelosporangium lantanae TaxID=1497396 RepID=A0ABW3M5M9_9PSEU